MATKISATISDWVYKKIIESNPKNLSERLDELLIKGLQQEQKEVDKNGEH